MPENNVKRKMILSISAEHTGRERPCAYAVMAMALVAAFRRRRDDTADESARHY